MNIVKGVAGLIRRSSGSHGGESSSGSPLEKFSPPTPLIHFSKTVTFRKDLKENIR
ncbi:hypothetical protein KY290_022440 [Solanum tuberosum]|uniref:Uncharacterized protein n=1 Tax=Solanum tuberosum TaxID=4113 RepID=A0ABQ7V6F2_SOLTU|nr:hypothetical protein KY289_027118 [Solanum tuberosum]KAH0758947.1 hypothetical protein KY290_022440 [Solanum tuberosum]